MKLEGIIVTLGANAPSRGNFEDRPITPMQGTYRQVAEKYGDEDDTQYYDTRSNDRRQNERTLPSQRAMSASQRFNNEFNESNF